MILTTTPSVEGRTISGYKGVVFGEVISGVNFTRAFDDYEYFSNSENNIAFYKKLGFEVFDDRTIEHDGKTMGSWSVKKKL